MPPARRSSAPRALAAVAATPVPYHDHGGITIYHGDARELLPQLDVGDVGIDLVVTDPPYLLGLASSQRAIHTGWADLMNAATWYADWLTECRRLTEPRDGAAWVFNSWRSFPVLARAAYEARWPIDSLLVWDKQHIRAGGSRGLRPRYEVIALLAHRRFLIADRSVPDLWHYPCSTHKPTGHPSEKPVGLLRRLIELSGARKVLDPFMGSGSTLVAAKALGCEAIGIEIEERWCRVAVQRLQPAPSVDTRRPAHPRGQHGSRAAT